MKLISLFLLLAASANAQSFNAFGSGGSPVSPTVVAGAIDTTKLATDAVTTVKILNANVDTAKLATDSVSTAKILNANVDTTKLATDSVTGAKILNATVTGPKLAAAFTIDHTSVTINNSFKLGVGGTPLTIISTGAYTPTLTNTTNVAASTPLNTRYVRIGNVVMVSGLVLIDPTLCAETNTVMGMTIPIASNFTDTLEAVGTASSVSESAKIYSDATNDRVTFDYNCESDLGNQGYYFQFTYPIQ